MVNKTETGYDGELYVGSTKVPITNVTYDDEINTADVQHNDSLKPQLATTGIRYSGSFEHSGSNERVARLVRDLGGGPTKGQPRYIKIKVYEDERKTIFTDCVVTTRSREMPSDDVTSESYDFEAEDMDYVPGGIDKPRTPGSRSP